jgi:hypothetical protein
MFFFPDNPELLFLYLYHLRLQEVEDGRRGQEMDADQPGLSVKVRLAYENCLIRVKAFSSKPQPEASSATIGAELGKLPH